ncbi:hypothetical protein D3C81_1654170 [compost metagenome]
MLPAGPLPLIPKRLLAFTVKPLFPQPDSSAACAIVSEAAMWLRCISATAKGAILEMNSAFVILSHPFFTLNAYSTEWLVLIPTTLSRTI